MPDSDAESPARFDEAGQPWSRRYGDVYFSKSGGLGQARAVFLAGCGLPARWRRRTRFTVAELGFGTGLNVAALLQLWARTRPTGAQLSIFSVDSDPLGQVAARRALSAFPDLESAAELLLARWPGRAAGYHRADLPEIAATLDVAVMDAAESLRGWSGRADAWFLDGFAPAVNPEMWSEELMALVAGRSAPGARAATWSVAATVRRSLAAAGFALERRPGFDAKRERLEARAPGRVPRGRQPARVVVIGAGIAGAALARAFRALGVEPRIFERERPGAGASGAPVALVTARLDAGLGPAARLHAQALRRASALYERTPGAVVARRVLQLESVARDAGRFAAIAASRLFEPDEIRLVSSAEASERMGEPSTGGIELTKGLVIEPAAALEAWAEGEEAADVTQLERRGRAWAVIGAGGAALAEAEIVCLAAGADIGRLWSDAPIQPARGQLSWAEVVFAPAAAWGPYVAPGRGMLAFGATYARGETDKRLRSDDGDRNLASLKERFPALAARVAAAPLFGRASVRATTLDRNPLVGEIATGLFVLGGLGARGFALAPLLAEHLAAIALGAPSPLPAPLAEVVRPGRFSERAARRRTMASQKRAI